MRPSLGKLKGIPIPERIFDYLFLDSKKADDIFEYMEDMFEEIVEEGFRPVLVFDELQSIKDILNATGKPVLGRLFNFLVGMTKEKHLCHSLCSTSDCLFIEDIYSNARLEGRAKYLLVDDLGKEEAFRTYEAFGFEDSELVWEYIGGKIGDMVSLFEEKKRGYKEQEALDRMLRDEAGRIEWMLDLVEEGEKVGPGIEEIKDILVLLKEGKIRIEFEHQNLEPMLAEHDQISNRLVFAIVVGSLIIGSSVVVHSGIPPKWNEIPVIGIIGYLVAGLMGFWLLISIIKHRKM